MKKYNYVALSKCNPTRDLKFHLECSELKIFEYTLKEISDMADSQPTLEYYVVIPCENY